MRIQPSLHLHLNFPSWFSHIWAHPPFLRSHSLISKDKYLWAIHVHSRLNIFQIYLVMSSLLPKKLTIFLCWYVVAVVSSKVSNLPIRTLILSNVVQDVKTRWIIINRIGTNTISLHLPLQLLLSAARVYPGLHLHLCFPLLFTHVCEHPPFCCLHSLISTKYCEWLLTKLLYIIFMGQFAHFSLKLFLKDLGLLYT